VIKNRSLALFLSLPTNAPIETNCSFGAAMATPSVIKRLKKGTFHLPKAAENVTRIEINAIDLSIILSRIDLANIKHQKRFQKPAKIAK
jgi:hypothetical protein